MSNSKLIKDFTAMFSSELVLFAASFISFPIYTRLLPKADYGYMCLVTMSLLLVVNISCGGLNNAILRFFGSNLERKACFANTIRGGVLGLTVIGGSSYVVAIFLLKGVGLVDGTLFAAASLAAVLVVIRGLTRIELALFRVTDRVLLMNVFNILIRYSTIALTVWLVYRYRSIMAFYLGVIIAEFLSYLCILVAVALCVPQMGIKRTFDTILFRQCMSYGLPLAVTSITAFALTNTDRYVIGVILDSGKVADYVVAVNYCNYPVEILRNVYLSTFIPAIMKSWNEDESGDNSLITQYISSYSWLAFPMVVGLSLTDAEGITLLAGAKYHAVPGLVPLLAVNFALTGLEFVYVCGLLYRKRSKMVMLLTVGTLLLNILLNLAFVRGYGLLGAAGATLISNIVFIICATCCSRKEITFAIPYKDVLMAASAGVSIALVVGVVPSQVSIFSVLAVKVAAGIVAYVAFLWLFSRSTLMRLVHAFR